MQKEDTMGTIFANGHFWLDVQLFALTVMVGIFNEWDSYHVHNGVWNRTRLGITAFAINAVLFAVAWIILLVEKFG